MIETMLKLLGKITTGPHWVMLQDGDVLEIKIHRVTGDLTIFKAGHYSVSDEGHRIPVAPLPIMITIEGALKGERSDDTERMGE